MKDNFDVHKWNQNRYLKRIDESDDPTIGAELEGDPDERVEENKSYLEFLSKTLGSMNPELDFNISGDRINVIGSEQDKFNWGDDNHGKKFGEYEVFHVEDDDRGEIVRIVKSDSISRNFENLDEERKYNQEEELRLDLIAHRKFDCDFKKCTDEQKAEVLKDKDKVGVKETIKETIKFTKENNPEFTNEEIKAELKEIKSLGKQLNEKLCKKGEDYRKRRMAAGEKSSAYLSGRAVKVCKGQMSGKKKKK